ncbi:hypothetical protein K505DRAFT_280942 [Melanomma pulvis-pyrius CBS 109.77]|uniref:CFEM domain-containing protein n=1 Tax=Melanomma pulvis-pyrius CBS 109.77 TaxID=1314802 RepID=A0A6A6X593_9PLEO|nr:hypothetical protein K505DRAFT_280942 [Melanomma pulvis-pyrius CBS 109.77]
MRTSLALLLSAGLAAQTVSATWNKHAGKFNSPEYNNNECSDKQKDGFSWGDLPEGNFGQYGDFEFQGGWSCKNKFGKRDSLTKRSFNTKCITNKVRKDKPAAFDCSKRKDGFSVKEIQVSVEFDCDLEFHYKMPDKTICKHVSPCKKDGTTVQNTQCGGAQSVEVYLGNHNQPDKEDCEIGLHHIGFDCNPPYQPPNKPSTTSEVVESTSVPVQSTSAPIESTSAPIESTSAPVESTTEVVQTTSEAVPTTTQPPVETPYTTNGIYTNSTAVYTPPPPGESSSTVLTTEVPPPATSTDTPGYSAPPPGESSSQLTTDVPPPATTTGGVPYGPGSSSSPEPSSPPTPEGPGYTPPDVLPKCMQTWLEINTQCKDNTDSNCYCKNPDFTKNVIDCVSAWSTDAQIQEALQYLIGICAPYVPGNPGLITDCPSNIPINPTGGNTPPTAAVPTGTAPVETTAVVVPPPAGPTGPVTTITYKTTVTVPCSTGGSTVTTISTEVTVPQVIFHTQTPGPNPGPAPSAPVELVPGTPPPVPAQTTGAPYPIPSSLSTVTAPFASGTGATTSAPPAEFTGAASSVNAGLKPAGVVLGAVLAFFAL